MESLTAMHTGSCHVASIIARGTLNQVTSLQPRHRVTISFQHTSIYQTFITVNITVFLSTGSNAGLQQPEGCLGRSAASREKELDVINDISIES